MTLKIGLVSPYDWNYTNGVREHIHHLATQFKLMGHDVRILAPANDPKNLPQDEHIYPMGRSVPLHINGTVVHTTCAYTLNRSVQHVFQKEVFDIIHIHEPLFPGLPLTALRASNAVTIGTFHAYPETKLVSAPFLGYAALAPFVRSSSGKLAGRIAVSSVAQQFVERFFPDDYQIIPNGVDIRRFSLNNTPFSDLIDEKQNILYVGRFDRRKGAKYLVQAIPLIRALYPQTRFIFVGEGQLRQDLQRFVQRQGWPDVLFTGYVQTDVLPRYFASAHLFCSPATGGESMGIVLLEAMASGLPLVATRIPGYTTVVNDGRDGLLATPGDSEDLACVIGHLLANRQLQQQFRMQGREKALHYAWSSVSQRILEYYLSLLELRHGIRMTAHHAD